MSIVKNLVITSENKNSEITINSEFLKGKVSRKNLFDSLISYKVNGETFVKKDKEWISNKKTNDNNMNYRNWDECLFGFFNSYDLQKSNSKEVAKLFSIKYGEKKEAKKENKSKGTKKSSKVKVQKAKVQKAKVQEVVQ